MGEIINKKNHRNIKSKHFH